MNCIDQINRAVDYIEDHLDTKVDINVLARKAGMSKWHFQRTFRAMVGDTVKEYTEKRRLSKAAFDLVNTKTNVLDIALAYDFDSHEVFLRAFKRVFSNTPSEFRELNVASSRIPQKPAITLEYLNHLYGGISMEPVIKKISKMNVVGMSEMIYSVHDQEFPSNFETVPALWKKFRGRMGELQDQASGQTVGLIVQTNTPDEAEALEYVAGVITDSVFSAPNGFVWRTIPGGEYAEFIHKGPVKRINHTMNYIYGSWLPKSGRTRGNGPEFSFRDEGFDPESESCEVKVMVPLG